MRCPKYGFGDVADLDGVLVKIVTEIRDEDGSIWYEVEPVEFKAFFNREVPEEKLKEVKP